MKILITGISGKLGQRTATKLSSRGDEVIGIDRRPWAEAPSGVEVHQTDIRKRAAEDVFRAFQPDAVVHMATVTHISQQSEDRYRINLQGTRAIVDHCHRYGVKQLIFVGRHTYYGAAPDSPLYHSEDEPPLGIHSFPELADLVAADLYAGSALWRVPTIDTAVLRIVYTLGPGRHGTLANYLRGPRIPTVLGFDPLFQFMHEFDVANAIAAAIDAKIRGVFNVAGPAPMPLSAIIREAGRQAMPVPDAMMHITLGRFGIPFLPKGAIDHLKYPIIVDASAFKRATGFQHSYDESETIRAFAEAE